MLPSVLIGVIAAVLCPDRVVLVDVATARPTGTVALPGVGAAVFAAPDGRLLVPLVGADATLVLDGAAVVARWRGRLFPLFYDEPDHMHVVLPEVLLTLTYPERLPVTRVPIPGLTGARRAAVNRDGRLVAIAPAAAGSATLLIAAAVEGGSARRIALGGDARLLALAGDGAFAVVATGQNGLELALPGTDHSLVAQPLDGTVTAVAVTDRREVIVGVAAPGGAALVGMKVDPSGKPSLKPKFRTPLPAAATALAVAHDDVVAIAGDQIVVLSKHGRRVRQIVPLVGGLDVTLLPERPTSAVPAWSDATPH